ncbi:hypothetical protein [Actinomyces sp. Z3]|uniref:hypothetical protein n=1 Tax=Actinomyces sp. Z3 TaxID=2250217 RepID=UPI000D591372|nr:hypothetical protein [Actinomyces sp. Z3]
MRRRTVLATALAATLGSGALAGLTACSSSGKSNVIAPTPSPVPAATIKQPPVPAPPSSTSCPSGFSSRVLWPTANVPSAITAVHEHYLAGTAEVNDDLLPETNGLRPVVVDLNGPTTWAVLLDEDGELITKEVDLKDSPATSRLDPFGTSDDSASPTPGLPYTALSAGPAVIDGTHAYLVVAAVDYAYPGETIRGSMNFPVSLVKVNLTNGALETSTTISEGLPIKDVIVPTSSRHPGGGLRSGLYLSLSPDRTGLLLSADPSSDSYDAQPLGLRLSTEDLSVELDVLADVPNLGPFDLYGEAVRINSSATSVISLADGQEVSIEAAEPFFAWNGWLYYYGAPTRSVNNSCYAREMATGQTIALDVTDSYFNGSTVSYAIGSSYHVPGIFSDQRQLLFTAGPFYYLDPPSSTTGAPGWDKSRPAPQAACVFGDVLYTVPAAGADTTADVELTSVTTGEPLGEVAGVGIDWPIAVTAWGLACGGSFYPANAWLD